MKKSRIFKWSFASLLTVVLASFFLHSYLSRPFFSIIVSSYNYADYLPKTIDSIFSSTFNDFELIVVNDGSTDNTQEILEEYKKKYPSLIIINQKNQGLSISRNNAMKIAKGKWFWFVDSDDWIDRNALSLLHQKAISFDVDIIPFKQADIDSSGKYQGYNGYHGLPAYLTTDSNLVHTIDFMSFGDIIYTPVTSGKQIYNRSFLEKHNITFPPKTLFEDDVFFITSLFHKARISSIPRILYYKRSHNQAITSNKAKYFDSYIRICMYIWNNNLHVLSDLHNIEKFRSIFSYYSDGIVDRFSYVANDSKVKFIPDIKKYKAFLETQTQDEFFKDRIEKFMPIFDKIPQE